MCVDELFPTSFRGYERSDVDRALERLENELATLRQTNSVLSERVEETRSELIVRQSRNRELNSRLKSGRDKASYANLGSQFEEYLRVGEERSERLVSEARAEAELLRQTTQAKASRTVREAEEFAQRLLSDTHSRIDEMRLKSESSAAETTAVANTKLAEASEIVSTARRGAASRIAEVEREIAEARSALKRRIELERAELQEIADHNARALAEAEEEIRLREDQLERDNMRAHQNAVEAANRMIGEANDYATQVALRASEIAAQAEASLTQANLKAESILADARALASGMLDQARIRVTELSAKTRLHIDLLLERTVARADRLREERELLDEYLAAAADPRSSEMIVSGFEERAHSIAPVERPEERAE